jgi:stalled ribosome alternative rescue factor ArfA
VAYTNLRGTLIEKGNVDPDALQAVITLAKIRSRLREKRKNKG